jgi:hypothetical protein
MIDGPNPSSLIVASPLKRAVSVAQELVKIELVLSNIPLDIHELAGEDGPILNFEPAVLGRC